MPFHWQDYLGSHPNLGTLGPKVTATMTAAERLAFLDLEDQFHGQEMTATGREAWPGEWQAWEAVDPGTRLLLYWTASHAVPDPSDWTHWGAMEAVLPYELLPTAGFSIEKDRDTFNLALAFLGNLAAQYDRLLTRAKTGVTPMTIADYIAAHPELVAAGDQWSRAMTADEKARLAWLESAYHTWSIQNGNADQGWNEWQAETTPGLRLLFYAGAYDAGLNATNSVANLFPPAIAKPRDPSLAAEWYGLTGAGIMLFAQLRDQVLARNNANAAITGAPAEFKQELTAPTPATPSTIVPSGSGLPATGSSTPLPATTAGAATGSSSGMGLLLLLLAAAYMLTKR